MRRDRRGDADRAVGHLQELRHDEGGRAHHRRHQLAAGRADQLDRGGLVAREARLDHGRDGDDADREHVRHRAARNHAEQRRAHHRDLGRAAAEAAHRRHGDVGEKIGAAGAGQHLAHDGERDHDQHCHRQDRADHAVGVEAEVGDHPLRRHPAGLEIARQIRADIDVDRHCQDDRDEAEARGAAAAFQHQEQQDRAADDAFDRQHREFVGQRLVAHEDVAAQDERHGGAGIIEGARELFAARQERPRQRGGEADPKQQRNVERIGKAVRDVDENGDDGDRAGRIDGAIFAPRLDHEGERQRQAEASGQQLLGIERKIEDLPGDIHHPEHDAGDQQSLQQVGQDESGFRRGGGELLRARYKALLGRGGLARRARRLSLFVHWNALAAMFFSLKYFKAPGWN